MVIGIVRHRLLVNEIVPVVVVIEHPFAQVAAIGVDQSRVIVHHPGIDDAHHCPLTSHAEGVPGFVGTDLGDVPLHRVRLEGNRRR